VLTTTQLPKLEAAWQPQVQTLTSESHGIVGYHKAGCGQPALSQGLQPASLW